MTELDAIASLIASEKQRGDALYALANGTDGQYAMSGLASRLRRSLPEGENAQRVFIDAEIDDEIAFIAERHEMGNFGDDEAPLHPEAMRFLLERFARHEARMIGLRRRMHAAVARVDGSRLQIIGTAATKGPQGVLAHPRAELPAMPAALPTSNARPSDLATAHVA